MEAPLVSIITPTYNSAAFISQTIHSIQQQTHINWELLVVDDCSTDTTQSIIERFAALDTRIKFRQLSQNSGAGVARNTAVEMASGQYIAFLDSDDLWKPEKLERQLRFMQEEQVPFTFSFYDCMDEQGNALGKRIEAPRTLHYYQLFFCNFVGNLTGIYDTRFFGRIPISKLRKRQDWMVWLTVLRQIKKARPVPESLAYYRIRENSVSASKWGLLQHNFAVYRQFHQLNVLASLCSMIGFLCVQLLVKPLYVKKTEAAIETV